MIVNETRGSYGMFSRAGRSSADKHNILVRKDEILGGASNKRKVHKDMFAPDEKKRFEDDEEVDIFKVESSQKTNLVSDGSRQNIKIKKPKSEITKYLEMRKKTKKKHDNPSCTKYNPKNEFVWKKILTGPKWDLQGIKKTNSRMPKEEFDPPFYQTNSCFGGAGKNLIEMARQTRRASFSSKNNVRSGNTKSPNRENDSLSKGKTTNSFYKDKNSNAKMNTFSSELSDSINDQKKKTKNNIFKSMSNTHTQSSNNKWIRIQAPDFKKNISREHLERVYGDKRNVIPFSIPDDKLVRPRPVMMVKYDQINHPKYRNSRPITSEPFDINYDPHKALNFVNNNRKPNAPNFDMMISRPSDNDPLPCYLKNVHSRQATEIMTEKALKMNNFSEGKFSQTQTSFFPKKSFNKIINLNLINSSNFKENAGITNEIAKSNEANDYILKSMKFYNKNYDDLIKESMLSKFDNITFKTIKRESKFETAELEKFLINFDNLEA